MVWEKEEEWYFPELSREQARTILQGQELGVFLVRVSGTADRPGPVLSASHIVGGTQRTIHFAIDKLADGKFAIGSQTFTSLHAILMHYRSCPLTDDGLLRLSCPADVRYFAKNDWTGDSELTDKVRRASEGADLPNLKTLPMQCGQILRLINRNPFAHPVVNDDGNDAKLWLMENDQGIQGLVPSTSLLVFVRSDYESFMQRQRQLENSRKTREEVPLSPRVTNENIRTPPPPVHAISRPGTFSSVHSPFSDRRLGVPSQADTIHSTSSVAIKAQSADKFEMPRSFPAKAVAVLDRNPNFYDRSQLRFRKGDLLTVLKPATVSPGIEDTLTYGFCEAIAEENGRRGLIPIYNSYIKWL